MHHISEDVCQANRLAPLRPFDQGGHHRHRGLGDGTSLAVESDFFDPVPVEEDLNLDLVTAHRIGDMGLHGVIGELPLVPRVAVVLEDELLVQRG